MRRTTVILPCAGKGTRLGIPFPKELFPIQKDISIIDTYFDELYEIRDKIRVVIIINPKKVDLVEYLNKYSDSFDIIFKYQTDYEKGMVGAIYECRNYFLENNIILLPDIFIKYKGFINELMSFINGEDKVAIWFNKEKNVDILKNLGPVTIENNGIDTRIVNFEEKPQYTEGNAYWVSMAFKKICSDAVLESIEAVFSGGEMNIKKTPLFGALGFEVEYAIDLGIWKNIQKFFAEN